MYKLSHMDSPSTHNLKDSHSTHYLKDSHSLNMYKLSHMASHSNMARPNIRTNP
jgi:hypothetical protein